MARKANAAAKNHDDAPEEPAELGEYWYDVANYLRSVDLMSTQEEDEEGVLFPGAVEVRCWEVVEVMKGEGLRIRDGQTTDVEIIYTLWLPEVAEELQAGDGFMLGWDGEELCVMPPDRFL